MFDESNCFRTDLGIGSSSESKNKQILNLYLDYHYL